MQCRSCVKLILSELGADEQAGPFRCGAVPNELRQTHKYQATQLEALLFSLAEISACPYFVQADQGQYDLATYNPDEE